MLVYTCLALKSDSPTCDWFKYRFAFWPFHAITISLWSKLHQYYFCNWNEIWHATPKWSVDVQMYTTAKHNFHARTGHALLSWVISNVPLRHSVLFRDSGIISDILWQSYSNGEIVYLKNQQHKMVCYILYSNVFDNVIIIKKENVFHY